MDFNKINFEKNWKKLDITADRVVRSGEPLCTITKQHCLSFNKWAALLAHDLGFEHKYVDMYQAGAEFAFAVGSSLVFHLYMDGGAKGKSPYGNIGAKKVGDKIWAATKCRVFRVRREDKYLVLTPAYDLEPEEKKG